MPERKKKASAARSSVGFSAEERAAMKEYAKELKAASRGKEAGEAEVLEKLNAMPEPDRKIGKKIHEIIKTTAPELVPRTWYGMPAYAKDGNVVCYFQNASKFKARYAMLGFSDKAKLDDGSLWPVAYAVKQVTAAEEKKITALVKKAVR